eukprot:Hpha_TRINITY_DN15207_c2_g10::TRINITY_DN15207_c2_g10_i1::g.67047::m.67047
MEDVDETLRVHLTGHLQLPVHKEEHTIRRRWHRLDTLNLAGLRADKGREVVELVGDVNGPLEHIIAHRQHSLLADQGGDACTLRRVVQHLVELRQELLSEGIALRELRVLRVVGTGRGRPHVFVDLPHHEVLHVGALRVGGDQEEVRKAELRLNTLCLRLLRARGGHHVPADQAQHVAPPEYVHAQPAQVPLLPLVAPLHGLRNALPNEPVTRPLLEAPDGVSPDGQPRPGLRSGVHDRVPLVQKSHSLAMRLCLGRTLDLAGRRRHGLVVRVGVLDVRHLCGAVGRLWIWTKNNKVQKL